PLYVANLAIPGSGVHNVVFVATEKDTVFAFDADASPCQQLWKTSLIPAGSQAVPAPNLDLNSNDITPFIGITGTPAISVSASYLYVVAKTSTAVVNPAYSERLYALDLATGQPKIVLTGMGISVPALPSTAFDPLFENQRAALLLDNGSVYIAFGMYRGIGSDQGLGLRPHGWLLAYDASTLQQTAAFSVTPSNSLYGGIWQSGGGPSADANHNVYAVTGDGPFDANRGGTNYSNSFLRLRAGAASAADYFTPCDEASFNFTDFGATSPLLLPDSAGTVSAPHLAVSASKAGSLYIVNRDSLGGYTGACPDWRAQTVQVGSDPIFGTPLFWNNSIYVAAGNEKLKVFPMTGGILSLSPSSSQSAEDFGPMGATPVVSYNSISPSNAILWVIDSGGALATPNSSAILRAFDPGNFLNEIYNSKMNAARDAAGPAVKFTVPTV
ncbi:MAG: hypothetical protein ACRD4Y_00900, partial [Candidatus Acidiferrales bacterium]